MAATTSSGLPLRDRSNVMYRRADSEPQYFRFNSPEKVLNKTVGIPINIERSPRDSPDIFKKKPRTQTLLSPAEKGIIKEAARAVQAVYSPLTLSAVKKTILKPSRCASPAGSDKTNSASLSGMERIHCACPPGTERMRCDCPSGHAQHIPSAPSTHFACPPGMEKRKVQFNHSVAVCLIDTHGDRLCTTNENLNTHEGGSDNPMYARLKRSKTFTLLSYSTKPSHVVQLRNNSPSSLRSPAGGDTLDSSSLIRSEATLIPPTGVIHQTSVSNESKINISFLSDPAIGTKLQFSLYLGTMYSASDVVVKACTNGSKLRVVASHSTVRHGVTSLSQFNERFTMPMEVDPFAVDATMDTRGYLTVEAPLMTSERRARARQRLLLSTDV